MQLTTARFLLGSGPSQLFLSFGLVSEIPRPRASELRAARLRRTLSPPTRLRSAKGLRSVALAARSRLFTLLRSPPSFGGLFRNLASVRHTPPAPSLWGSLHGSAFSLKTGDTPNVSHTKKGTCFHVPSGCQIQSVNSSVTVFSVELSNALAASVTGR